VSEREFVQVESHFKKLNSDEGINASEFELLTATAFELFNRNNVQVGVVEVGMGGKLDATNILNNQVVSVISIIAREHQNFLGNTLEEIAHHKAGILRPKVPYIVNPVNEWNVHDVIDQYAKEIGAGPRIFPDTQVLRQTVFSSREWHQLEDHLLPFQRDNVVLACLAVCKVLESLNQSATKAQTLLPFLKNKQPLGRLRHHTIKPVFGRETDQKVLVDGAHNENAAAALQQYVQDRIRKKRYMDERSPRNGWPITWVLAMSDGKDAHKIVRHLLRPGDNVITTTFGPVDGMPWVKPMDPRELLRIAMEVCEDITGIDVPISGAFRALCAAKHLARGNPIVLTGSLYLVGDFFRENRAFKADDPPDIKQMDWIEMNRVNNFLSLRTKGQDTMINGSSNTATHTKTDIVETERRKLVDKIDRLDREMQTLEQEENRLTRAHLMNLDDPGSNAKLNGSTNSIPGFEIETRQADVKQKPIDDNEDIRKPIEGVTAVPTTPLSDSEPTSAPNLHEMARKTSRLAGKEEILTGRAQLHIRAHYAGGPDEQIPQPRLIRTVPEIPIRHVGSNRDEQPVVRSLSPLKLGFGEGRQ
jgi:folylpolyglutamate synthase/dihydrofolate synthase